MCRYQAALFVAYVLCVLLHAVLQCRGADAVSIDKWEPDIAAFEARDAESPPPKRGVLFVGSSSIRLWDLNESFPELKPINRGFGGSEMADSVRYAKRIVLPHEPRTIVVYAGDNDIANGKPPEQVFSDFKDFVKVVRGKLPDAKIVYIGIKPSIKRWALIDKIRAANRLIREHIEAPKSAMLEYVDTEQAMLGKDGLPRKDLLVEDGLHLSKEGYKVWTKRLSPHIEPN